MSPQPNLRELSPIEQIRREMQQQERQRAMHPELRTMHIEDRRLLTRIWVGYVWHEDVSTWVLYGFRRKPQRLTWRAIKRVRRKLHVPRGATLELIELWQAQRDGPPVVAPQRYVRSTAPDVIDDEVVALIKHRRARSRRFTKKTSNGFGRAVKFVAIASPRDHHQKQHLFLGPLMANTPKAARAEAMALWQGLYATLLEVHPITAFKKGIRRRMRSGAIRPGKSRLKAEKMFVEEMIDVSTLLTQEA